MLVLSFWLDAFSRWDEMHWKFGWKHAHSKQASMRKRWGCQLSLLAHLKKKLARLLCLYFIWLELAAMAGPTFLFYFTMDTCTQNLPTFHRFLSDFKCKDAWVRSCGWSIKAFLAWGEVRKGASVLSLWMELAHAYYNHGPSPCLSYFSSRRVISQYLKTDCKGPDRHHIGCAM